MAAAFFCLPSTVGGCAYCRCPLHCRWPKNGTIDTVVYMQINYKQNINIQIYFQWHQSIWIFCPWIICNCRLPWSSTKPHTTQAKANDSIRLKKNQMSPFLIITLLFIFFSFIFIIHLMHLIMLEYLWQGNRRWLLLNWICCTTQV